MSADAAKMAVFCCCYESLTNFFLSSVRDDVLLQPMCDRRHSSIVGAQIIQGTVRNPPNSSENLNSNSCENASVTVAVIRSCIRLLQANFGVRLFLVIGQTIAVQVRHICNHMFYRSKKFLRVKA